MKNIISIVETTKDDKSDIWGICWDRNIKDVILPIKYNPKTASKWNSKSEDTLWLVKKYNNGYVVTHNKAIASGIRKTEDVIGILVSAVGKIAKMEQGINLRICK